MSNITQSIPNYTQGLSEQPDQFKNPGQVSEALNVVPEIQTGLIKRPGSKYVDTLYVSNNATFFHYYRDQTEQYIGQIERSENPNDTSYIPTVRMWDIRTGEEKAVAKSTVGTAGINSYLRHSTKEDLQFLTVNDYTYIVNRTKTVQMLPTTVSKSLERPDEHCAYVELRSTSNARQYSLNLFDDNTATETIKSVTRIKAYRNIDGSNADIEKRVFPFHTPFPDKSSDNVDSRPKMDSGYNAGGTTAQAVTLINDSTCCDVGTQVFALNDLTDDTDIMKIWHAEDSYANPLWSRSIGTETVNGISYTGGWKTGHARILQPKNLVWRWTVTGVSGRRSDDGDGSHPTHYHCTYDYDVELLFGGEGWEIGDRVEFVMKSRWAHAADITYRIEVEEVTATKVRTSLGTSKTGDIRPSPTPFDAHTAVSSTSILGGLESAINSIGNNFTTKVIGNGLYIKRTSAFNIETAEKDLMNIMTTEINDVGKLPTQCKHNYIVKVSNTDVDEDDYYLRFEGKNEQDGPGSWQECAEPGIEDAFDPATMPIQLVRQSDGSFLIQQVDYPRRSVGSENDGTNTVPSFVGNNINKALFWSNRVIFLSSNNAIASQPGDSNILTPSFWSKTALTLSPEDVIDLAASSTYPAKLVDGLEVSSGLLLFSENQQFMLLAEAEVLNPETAKINAQSTYNYNVNVSPFSLGTSAGFIDNAGANSRFFEMTDIRRTSAPAIVDQSITVPSLLPKNIDLVTNSRENTYVLFAVSGDNFVYGYRYFNTNQERLQAAWFKWELQDNIKYHCIIDDTYYVLHTNNNLVSFDLRTESDTAYIDVTSNEYNTNTVNYPLHLDNYVKYSSNNFEYDSETRKTTFTIPDGFAYDKDVAVINDNPNDETNSNFGQYAIATVSGNQASLLGNWETNQDLYVGYNYNMQIKFPTIYLLARSGENAIADVNMSLVIHRLKLTLGMVGVYETTIERKGREDYTELFESSTQDAYLSNTSPWVDKKTHTIPTYDRNTNLAVYLKSTHPSPATLHSLSWEGDANTKFYQRV